MFTNNMFDISGFKYLLYHIVIKNYLDQFRLVNYLIIVSFCGSVVEEVGLSLNDPAKGNSKNSFI